MGHGQKNLDWGMKLAALAFLRDQSCQNAACAEALPPLERCPKVLAGPTKAEWRGM